MNTTTILTGVGASVGTVSYTLNDEKKVDSKKARNVLSTSVSLTGMTVAGSIMNQHTVDEIYEKYASAYVESMSDEQLEAALQQMDLLEAEIPEETDSKTI